MPDYERDEELDEMLPAGLPEELRRFEKERIFVPPEVDRSVLAQADRHFRRIQATRRWAVWSAVAAFVLGAGVFSKIIGTHLAPHGSHRVAAVREDVDGNGQVNVLDAFALARLVEQKAESQRLFDMNGDGKIDKRDIDHVALKAVRLEDGNL